MLPRMLQIKEAGMFGLGGTEIVIILLILVILFGASRLPQLGSSMGSAIRNFKKGFSGEETPEEKAKAGGQLSSTTSADAKPVEKAADKA
jgi:TatA/E family protein of Tat protein translocase